MCLNSRTGPLSNVLIGAGPFFFSPRPPPPHLFFSPQFLLPNLFFICHPIRESHFFIFFFIVVSMQVYTYEWGLGLYPTPSFVCVKDLPPSVGLSPVLFYIRPTRIERQSIVGRRSYPSTSHWSPFDFPLFGHFFFHQFKSRLFIYLFIF